MTTVGTEYLKKSIGFKFYSFEKEKNTVKKSFFSQADRNNLLEIEIHLSLINLI